RADCLATLRAARSLYDGRGGLDTVWTRALTGPDDLRQATGCKRLSQVKGLGGRMTRSRDECRPGGWVRRHCEFADTVRQPTMPARGRELPIVGRAGALFASHDTGRRSREMRPHSPRFLPIAAAAAAAAIVLAACSSSSSTTNASSTKPIVI